MAESINSLLVYGGEVPVDPPKIILGQFERVGSTFYCDQLEKTHLVHNEPYKMLVPEHWPIARGFQGQLSSIDDFMADDHTSRVDKHWLRNFVSSLHYPGAQVVKETNLYLALPNFLDLFPYSDVELLTRNPLGIVSSFKRNDLYNRWQYGAVAELLKEQLAGGNIDGHEALSHMLEQGHTWQQKIAWMIGLNAILISRHVGVERVEKVVSYESDIIPLGSSSDAVDERTQDSIFATNVHKTHDDFEERLSYDEIDSVTEAMQQCSEFVEAAFDLHEQVWFDQLYAIHLDRDYKSRMLQTRGKTPGKVSQATELFPQIPIRLHQERDVFPKRELVKLHNEQSLLWDYSLVTNRQMGEFLQSMLEAGQNPSYNYLLLLDNMPPSRGGRITYDEKEESYRATEGFNDHPVYWVTWLAAALYAYKQGMRLPSQSDWQKVYDSSYDAQEHPNANHTYANDDVVPTGVPRLTMPDDFFGNLKIWCSDWSNEQALSKRLAGISWKHYMHEGYSTDTERPYLTNSRVIGIRLVCCSECAPPQARTTTSVIEKFDEVITLIQETEVHTVDELALLNKKIEETLTPNQCSHQSEVDLS